MQPPAVEDRALFPCQLVWLAQPLAPFALYRVLLYPVSLFPAPAPVRRL